MREVDVVVSAFATPPQSDLRALAQPFGSWSDEVEVVGVDRLEGASDAAGFVAAADYYRDPDGFILRRLLSQRLRGVKIRRIALVGFSAGNFFCQKVLAGPDAPYVDTVVALDGMHIQRLWNGSFFEGSLAPWVRFGVRAASGAATDSGPLMVVTHTAIRQDASREKQIGNTTDSARAVSEQVAANSPGAIRVAFDPQGLVRAPPPPAVTIQAYRPTDSGPVLISRTWDEMPMPAVTSRGNYVVLDYGGTTEADHIFQSRYVQGAVWRTFVRARWETGVGGCAMQGTEERCQPRGVVVPDGVYDVPEGPAWGWALAGFVVGFGVAFAAGATVQAR